MAIRDPVNQISAAGGHCLRAIFYPGHGRKAILDQQPPESDFRRGRNTKSGRDTTAAVGFDTLKFARRLEEAGVPQEQAEAQAEIMAEAFLLNMDALVTKDYLDARFAEQGARMETRFAAMDTRFAEVDGKLRLLMWMLAAVMASTVIPAVHRLLA